MIYSEQGMWYLYCDVGKEKVRIFDHFRREDSLKSVGEFKLLEKGMDDFGNIVEEVEGRIVDRVILNGTQYEVENPKYVFSYGIYTPEEIIELRPCWLDSEVKEAFTTPTRSVYNIAMDENISPWDRVWCMVNMLPMSIVTEATKEYLGREIPHRDLLLDTLGEAAMYRSDGFDTRDERITQLNLFLPYLVKR